MTRAEQQRKNLYEEQKNVSSNITNMCRYIGFGIAAAMYSIFSSNSDFAKQLLGCNQDLLILTSVSAIIILFFDYLQFLFGYFSVRIALRNSKDDYSYNNKSIFYSGRFFFFYAKQLFTLISVILLLYTLLKNLT